VQLLFNSIVFVLISFSGLSQENELSFMFVGDVMQHDGQIQAAYNKTTNTYSYDDGFKFIKPIINEYDIKLANLEVTLAGKPYKGYPQFSAPDELAETLVNVGFNLIVTSNNHSCDRGSKGVIRTLDKLDELGVAHTGTFRSQEERDLNYPLIINQKGMKVAVLNYTYGTNGLKVAKPLIINYIDSAVIRKDVEKAKSMNVDYIMCVMHWGKEYTHLPNNYQKKWEQFCYNVGVDMVVGGHPHTVQPIVKKEVEGEEKLTIWSLGNFVSNMKIRYTRGGVMVGATIKKEEGKVKLGDVEQCLVYVHKKQEGLIKHYYILPDYDYNAFRPDFLNATDLAKMNEFFTDSRKLFKENNVGVTEILASDESCTNKLYQKFLTSYYSVWLPTVPDTLLHDESMQNHLYRTVNRVGKTYILSGFFYSANQAYGNLRFIQDCNVTDTPRIVLIKPEGIEIVEE